MIVNITYRNRNLKNQSEFVYVTTTSMDSLMQIPDPNRRAAVCLKRGFYKIIEQTSPNEVNDCQ